MASRFHRPARSFRPAAAKSFVARRPVLSQPLPGCVVDAVLRYHDQSEDIGGGRKMLRLSPRRLHDAEVEAALGAFTDRAGRVSILWNEREDEIIRVLEDAPAQLAA